MEDISGLRSDDLIGKDLMSLLPDQGSWMKYILGTVPYSRENGYQ